MQARNNQSVPGTTAIKSGELASAIGAELLGDANVELRRLDAVELATAGSLTFVRSHKFARLFAQSTASAALITRDIPLADLIPGFDPAAPQFPRPLLVVGDVDAALIKCAAPFTPPAHRRAEGVHPTAYRHPESRIDPTACIGPHCTVSAGAVIGAGVVLVANVYVGNEAHIGARSIIHPNVSVLDRCVIGKHCVLHPGVVIGGDGFGFRPGPAGLEKIPHIGNVVIGEHVEIGACTCIDRAKFGSTTIGDGTKIDNLVQIGHGCRVGKHVVLCGQVGLAGSVIVGDGSMLGGKVGVADNLEIGPGAKIAAQSGVINNVPAGATFLGAPAGPVGEMRRVYAYMRRLGKRGGGHAGP